MPKRSKQNERKKMFEQDDKKCYEKELEETNQKVAENKGNQKQRLEQKKENISSFCLKFIRVY